MPVAATMTDVTNITYSDGGNLNIWRLSVRSVGGANVLGEYINDGGFSDGVEVASTIELFFESIVDPLNITAGDTFTISHDSTSTIAYCPAITTPPTTLYLDENGVLYSDSALTTAVTPDFDSVTDSITGSEVETETPGTVHIDSINLSETTSTESSNSLTDSLGVSELISWYIEGDTQSTWPTPTVHYTGHNPYDTDEAIFDSRLVAETDPVVGKALKVLVKDDNGEWVDFSDRFEQKGVDKLADYGQFKHASEKKGGLPIIESTIGSLIFDNSDGFFDGRVTGLSTELGNTASFDTSSDEGTETSWRRREVKFESHLTLIDDSIIVRNLGVFLVKELDSVISSKKASVSLTLESKMNLLKRTDASVVKDGMQWYRSRSIDFLVKELLKTQFADENNELPASFFVDEKIQIPVPSDIGDGIGYSVLGVPPQVDGRNTNMSYIRGMDIWTWNTGTVSSSTDNAYNITSSTTWGQEGTAGSLRPKPGDSITIKNSSNNNDGDYEIRSISSSTITLTTPLKGSTEAGMDYTIVRLFFIHDDKELWEYAPGTNTYNKITEYFIFGSSSTWSSVPYKVFVFNNRVHILECIKFNEVDTNVSLNTDYTWDRLSIWDGSSLIYRTPAPDGGDLDSTTALRVKTPIGMGSDTSTGWFQGATVSSGWGENIQIPFTQKVRGVIGTRIVEVEGSGEGIGEIKSRAAQISGVVVDQGAEPNSYIEKGWYTIRQHSADYSFEGALYIYWDRGDFEVFVPSWNSGNGSLVTLNSERTSGVPDFTPGYQVVIRMYDLNDGDHHYYYLTGGTDWPTAVVCIAYTDNNASKGDACFFSVLWNDAAYNLSSTAAVNRIYRINPAGTITEEWSEDDKTVLDLCQYGTTTSPTNAGFVVSMMSREDDDLWYELGTREWSGAAWTYTSLMRSASPFIRLKRGGPNEDYDVFIFHKYENRILRYDRSAGVLVAMAAGNEVVESEGSISSPLIIDQNTRSDIDIIYGVSWSGEEPWALGGLRLPNKGVLWKLDKYLAPFIELADFDGLSVGEAIGKLAQACNHVALFNVIGDFYFIPREVTDLDDYIIEHVGGKSLIVGDVKKDRGYSEIYNHFTIVPSIVQLTEVEWELILVKREEEEDDRDFTGFVEINSLNNLKRKIRLVCTRGGIVTESPLFKFLVEYDNIDARTGQEIQSDDTGFLLSSTFGGDQLTEGVHTGDFMILTNPDDGTQIVREILGGQGSNNIISVGGFTVNVGVASYYNGGDKIKLISSTDRFTSTIVSVTGGQLTLAETITGTFSNGDHALVEIKGSPAFITIEAAPGVVIPGGSEVVITRISASDDSSGNKAWSSDGVTYITTAYVSPIHGGTGLFVNNLDWISIGCWIEVNNGRTGSNSNGWGKVTAIDESRSLITLDRTVYYPGGGKSTLNVYWSPSVSLFVEIPQAGFEARIGDSSVSPLFKAGDVFTISTDGLITKDDSKSRKIAVSLSSKDKHGKLDFPSVKNRFIYPQLAEVLSRNLLELYKSPHYHLILKMYHLPFIDFVRISRLASYKIISDKLFPNQKDFTRSFYLRSVTIDLKKNMAQLELIDKDAY